MAFRPSVSSALQKQPISKEGRKWGEKVGLLLKNNEREKRPRLASSGTIVLTYTATSEDQALTEVLLAHKERVPQAIRESAHLPLVLPPTSKPSVTERTKKILWGQVQGLDDATVVYKPTGVKVPPLFFFCSSSSSSDLLLPLSPLSPHPPLLIFLLFGIFSEFLFSFPLSAPRPFFLPLWHPFLCALPLFICLFPLQVLSRTRVR